MTDVSPRDIEHVHNKKPAIEVDVPLKEFPPDALRALEDRDRELREEVQRRVLKACKGHSRRSSHHGRRTSQIVSNELKRPCQSYVVRDV